MNGLPRPSAFNLPYGVSLSDLEPDEPTCDNCGEECRDLTDGLCRECLDAEEEAK